MNTRCRPALGTYVEIAILDDIDDARASTAQRATDAGALFDAAFAAIARVQRLMSFHDPASDLSRVNRAAVDRAIAVDEWTFDVLAMASALFRRTEGVFDCTVASVLVERGILPGSRDSATDATFADVELDPGANTVRYRRPLLLDLGGIAKGFAVDRAIEALAARGVASAVVNAGGDLRVLGSRSVPIHRRERRGRAPRYAGLLCDGAFAVSAGGVGDAERAPAALVDARRRRIIDDDRTFAVIAPTCTIADALTKVLASGAVDAARTMARFDAVAVD